MELSRRKLLGAGGVALVTGLSGCGAPLEKMTSLSASIREPFRPDPPITVPLSIGVYLRNRSKEVAIEGAELVLCDEDREPVAVRELGDLSWERSPAEERGTKEHNSTTWQVVGWSLERSVELDEMPRWITFRVEDVWFGDDEDDEDGEEDEQNAVLVGEANASNPAPDLATTIQQFQLASPFPPKLGPGHFDSYYEEFHRGPPGDEPLFPRNASDPGSAVVEFWHGRPEGSSIENVAETFGEASGHTIRTTTVGGLREDPHGRLQSDELPHVFASTHTSIDHFLGRELLADQTGELGVRPSDGFVDVAGDAVEHEDRLFGLPSGAKTVALLYDRDVVEKPPETIAQLQRIAERHHDPENGVYGLYHPLSHPYYYGAWVGAFGGYYYDPESDSLGLTAPETIRGFEFVVDELVPYVPDGAVDESKARNGDQFSEGNAPFAVGEPRRVSRAEESGIDVGVAALPEPEGGSPRPYVDVETVYFASALENRHGSDVSEAPFVRQFVEWYTTNEELLVRDARTSGSVPVYEGAIEHDGLPKTTRGFVNSVRTGRPLHRSREVTPLYDVVQEAFEAVLAGERSVTNALSRAEDEVRTNWMRNERE